MGAAVCSPPSKSPTEPLKRGLNSAPAGAALWDPLGSCSRCSPALRPLRRVLCNRGVEAGPPIVIRQAPVECTQQNFEDVSDDHEDINSDHDFERLAETHHHVARGHNRYGMPRHYSKRAAKIRQIQKKAGATSTKFDHESSFDASSFASSRKSRGSAQRGYGVPELVQAVTTGSLEAVEGVLSTSPTQITMADRYRQNAVFWACSKRAQERIVVTLLRAKVPPAVSNMYGYTPLMRALHYGLVTIAELLLEYEADIEARDKLGNTCMHIVAAAGHLEAAKWILRKPECMQQVSRGDLDQTTPLQVAARAGHVNISRLLLEAAAEAQHQDALDRTALLFAFARHSIDIADLLLEYKADLNGAGMLVHLVYNISQHPEFAEATLCGLAAALEARADVDILDRQKQTPLIFATRCNAVSAVALLAVYQANLMHVDEEGITALIYARKRGANDVCRVLSEFGAIVGANPALNKGLVRAAFYGHEKACEKFVDRGAAVKDDTGGVDSVTVATAAGQRDAARILREAGSRQDAHAAVEPGETDGMYADPETLRPWIEALTYADTCARAMQRAADEGDLKAIISQAEAFSTKPLAVSVGDQPQGISGELLAAHLRYREAIICKTGRASMRALRTQMRLRTLHDFIAHVKAWLKGCKGDGKSGDFEEMVSSHSGIILATSISKFEEEHEQSRLAHEIQVEGCSAACQEYVDVSSVFCEEDSFMEHWPDENAVSQDKQSGKKRVSLYLNPEVDKEAKEKRQAEAAQSCIFNMQGIGKRYAVQCEAIERSTAAIRKLLTTAQRKSPESVQLLTLCIEALELLWKFSNDKQRACSRFIEVESARWGVNAFEIGQKEDKSMCQGCLLKPVTMMTLHAQGSCPCLCDTCAYEVKLRIKHGPQPMCQNCRQLVTGLAPLAE